MNQGKTFIERLMADFVQFSNTITRFLFLEQRLGTRLCLSLILRFCKNVLIISLNGTVIQIEKAPINYRLSVSKVS